jgi:hypothetical protein
MFVTYDKNLANTLMENLYYTQMSLHIKKKTDLGLVMNALPKNLTNVKCEY